MRLVVMPVTILAVGLWLSSMQQGRSAAQDDRVRLYLLQLLEECARDCSSPMAALDASDPVVAREFRSRLRAICAKGGQLRPMVEVRSGDLGIAATGDATHTALACYQGAELIAVRLIAAPGEGEVRLIGVFTPEQGEFPVAQARREVE